MAGFKCYLGHCGVRKLRIVIVGAGDVAKRLTQSNVSTRAMWIGLARNAQSADAQRVAQILPIHADLDSRASLKRAAALARAAFAVLYLAPPPNQGNDDPRLARWLSATARKPRIRPRAAGSLIKANARQSGNYAAKRKSKSTQRCVYVSTTGVYGDQLGACVRETTRVHAGSARAKRRVAAETLLRKHHRHSAQRATILRAPGIYAAERLPIERLRAGTPALLAHEDVYTNHIHADDLAHAVWLAIFRGRVNRVLNIVDDAQLKMGEYFDTVATALNLPKPPRLSRVMLQREVTPMLYSFMSESRRIENARMKRELRIKLRHSTPQDFLRTQKPLDLLQRSLL
jgi:dTDP-4-dehydrorhamnose reductase